MEYFDFELQIGALHAGTYQVSVTRAPAGANAQGVLSLPYDEQQLTNVLRGLRHAVQSSGSERRSVEFDDGEESPTAFGQRLYSALTASEEIRSAFVRSKDMAHVRGRGLRIRLRIDAPELAVLPWEFLKDPLEPDFIALSQWSPILRDLGSGGVSEPPRVNGPIRVLGMISSPEGEAKLNVTEERARIDAATALLQQKGLLKIDWLTKSTRWSDLQDALRDHEYHVFHFVGHGGFDRARGEGVLLFTDENGESARMGAKDVGRLLADERTLRLVVLNACLGARGNRTNIFSSTAATLVAMRIPAVVAMQYEISDPAALHFSQALYKALASGWPIDMATSEARKAVSFAKRDSLEWATPVLHMHAPDGALFALDPKAAIQAADSFAAEPPTPPAANEASASAPNTSKRKLDTLEFEKRVRDEVAARTGQSEAIKSSGTRSAESSEQARRSAPAASGGADAPEAPRRSASSTAGRPQSPPKVEKPAAKDSPGAPSRTTEPEQKASSEATSSPSTTTRPKPWGRRLFAGFRVILMILGAIVLILVIWIWLAFNVN